MHTIRLKRLANPRLGTYYGIYASGLVAVLLVLAIFEQMEVARGVVRALMFAAPALMYVSFGLAATASDELDFVAAGRRIPSFFNGLVLAMTAIGGVGFVAITGSLFLIGLDGMVLVLGWISGLLFMGVLLLPFLRKVGAPTVSGYLAARVDSRLVGVVAATLLSVPVLLLLVAEIRVAASAAALLTGQSPRIMAAVLTGLALATVAGGGMRSLTWASAAKAIAAMMALAIPVTIVSVMISNLPLPQMTQGNFVRNLSRWEVMRGLPTVLATPLWLDFPDGRFLSFSKRFLQLNGNLGTVAFPLTLITVLAGVAASPALLMRAGTTTSVYQTRKSTGWAVLLTALVLLTLAAVAAFARGSIMEQVIGSDVARLPAWFGALRDLGFAQLQVRSGTVTAGGVSFLRDTTIFSLPVIAQLPTTVYYFSLAGVIAAALIAIGAAITTLGLMLSEDAIRGAVGADKPGVARIASARIAMTAAAVVAAFVAQMPADPLRLALWALGLLAATGFPVMVLSVLWKRLNVTGAVASMTAGFAVTVMLTLMNEIGVIAFAAPLPGFVGMIAGFAVAVVMSQMTAPVGRHVLEFVRDMRVPGGETIIDRQQRIERMRSQRI